MKTCDDQAQALIGITTRLEGLRSALWTPANGETKICPAVAHDTERAGAA